MVCKTRAIYKTHVVAKHTESEPLQCEICKAWFKNKINHRHHYLTTHADTKHNKPMTCPTCGVIRKNKKALMSHMKVHDVAYKKHFTCTVCGFQCANNTQLRNHSDIHRTFREKVKCDQCLKEFTSLGGLRVSARFFRLLFDKLIEYMPFSGILLFTRQRSPSSVLIVRAHTHTSPECGCTSSAIIAPRMTDGGPPLKRRSA